MLFLEGYPPNIIHDPRQGGVWDNDDTTLHFDIPLCNHALLRMQGRWFVGAFRAELHLAGIWWVSEERNGTGAARGVHAVNEYNSELVSD